jgi:uncharacterized protein (DUF4415 family)
MRCRETSLQHATGGAFTLPIRHRICYESAMSRRPTDVRAAAERAFKAVTTPKPAEPAPKPPSLPGAKEMVSLRLDRDVLEYFQKDGPGWQDRINAALRKAAGK